MTRHRTVFLDRDGTLNRDVGFLRQPEQLELLPGVPQALRRLASNSFRLVVVTNQSGIARGYYSESGLAAIHARLQQLLEVPVDAWLHCPHHPDLLGPYGRQCDCRKPRAGQQEQAPAQLDNTIEGSFLVGDSARDLLAASSLPIRTVLVQSGVPTAPELQKLREAGASASAELADLPAAADWILAQQ